MEIGAIRLVFVMVSNQSVKSYFKLDQCIAIVTPVFLCIFVSVET